MTRLIACVLFFAASLAAPVAAQLGDAPAEAKEAFRRGNVLMRRGDVEQANAQYKEACETGDGRGCVAAAHNYRTGNKIPQSYETAADWYSRGCEAGIGAGCSALGYLAHEGHGMDRNYDLALDQYRRACDLGEPSGCAGAGNMLLTGVGGTRNRVEGARLLRESCNDGYEWACTRLRDLGQPRALGQ